MPAAAIKPTSAYPVSVPLHGSIVWHTVPVVHAFFTDPVTMSTMYIAYLPFVSPTFWSADSVETTLSPAESDDRSLARVTCHCARERTRDSEEA